MGCWEEKNTKWYEEKMVYCDLCGRVIPKMLWVAEVDARKGIFCDPDCERLYHEYWLPLQAQKASGAEEIAMSNLHNT